MVAEFIYRRQKFRVATGPDVTNPYTVYCEKIKYKEQQPLTEFIHTNTFIDA